MTRHLITMEATIGPPDRPGPAGSVRRLLWQRALDPQTLRARTIRASMSSQRVAWARARLAGAEVTKPVRCRARRRPYRRSLALLRLWRRQWRKLLKDGFAQPPRLLFAC